MTAVALPTSVAEVLWRQTFAQGGGSVDVTGRCPTSGYAVGGRVPAVVVPAWRDHPEVARESIARFVREHEGTGVLGTWEDDRTLYLDVCDVVPTLADALALARERGELEVWDYARGVGIPVVPSPNREPWPWKGVRVGPLADDEHNRGEEVVAA